ncbi:hypothetical protein [uncultured Methanobrevibacter sp.]|nr:hypothetical protein [uncultured Methanobrevibacter sp.]
MLLELNLNAAKVIHALMHSINIIKVFMIRLSNMFFKLFEPLRLVEAGDS